MSTFSDAAATDGEFSDDSRSVDIGRCGVDEKSVVADSSNKSMGELSQLLTPDAFLLGDVSGFGDSTTSQMTPNPPETLPGKVELSGPAPFAPNPQPHEASVVNSAAPRVEREEQKPWASWSGVGNSPRPPATALSSCAPASAPLAPSVQEPSSSAAKSAAPLLGHSWATAAVAPPQPGKTECRCGDSPYSPPPLSTTKPCVDVETRKRVLERSVGPGGFPPNAPAPLATGMTLSHVSLPRARKRQRSLAPILSAPRTVSYECSMCKESYEAEISSNPWWSLLRQECPKCKRIQIPRVDAASATKSIDYIHAICAEEGEGWESDG